MLRISHLRRIFLWRWIVMLRFLLKNVRLHPSVLLSGKYGSYNFETGVKLGSRCKICTNRTGTVYLSSGVWCSSDVEMETLSAIYLGSGTTVQRRATINGTVNIGDFCIIAPNAFISSGTHPFREYPDQYIREQEKRIIEETGSLAVLDRPVVIGNDCWIGVNAVICPGVKIGNGCIVGANSVVTHNVPDNTVVAGVPAICIGSREMKSTELK